MEQSKRVCLQYGTHNKVVTFVSDGLDDRARITEGAKRAFGADLSCSILDFQVYSKDFDEWVDLDSGDEVEDRSKLRIVCHVSQEELLDLTKIDPLLDVSDLSSECSSMSGSSNSVVPVAAEEASSDSSASALGPSASIKKGTLTFPGASASIKKETEVFFDTDAKEFLFPFTFPSNFSADIEADLKSELMTSRTMAAFMTAVAHSVFALKRYPSHSDFEVVARSVVHKYPFLSTSTGNGYEHISGMLKDRLKRFRRKRSACPPDTSSQQSPAQVTRKKSWKSLSLLSCEVPPVLPGEDEESYRRHMKKLVELAGKKSPAGVASTLMERSYAIRRKHVIENMPTVSQILDICPFLGRISEFFLEFGRILHEPSIQETCSQLWLETWSGRVMRFGEKEAKFKQKVRAIITNVEVKNPQDNQSKLAVLVLSALVLKSGQPSDILKKLHPSDDLNIQAKNMMSAPSLLCTPTDDGQQYFLAVEGQIVLEVASPADVVGALLGAFFVFNIKYPQKLKHFYLALEYMLLKKTSEKLPISLKVLMNNLERV